MPDTLVITSSPSDWAPLAEITCKAMKAYCDRHGYGFFSWTADTKDRWFNPATKQSELLPTKGFVKLDLFLRWLPEYRHVVWLDADLLITNPAITLEDLWYQAVKWPMEQKIVLPYEHNGHNATVIMARSCDLVYDFFWAANNTGRKLFLGHDWVEMEAMRYFAQTPPYDNLIAYLSAKKLCPILHTEYIEAGLPERVSSKYGWAEGDFALHLSALHIDRRVELAREYSARFPCESA